MTGLGFFFGGINCIEQYFNAKLAQTIGMLLMLAVLALVIPTASRFLNHTSQHGIAAQSRGTAIIIMLSYMLWLFFQLKTNREMFDDLDQSSPQAKRRVKKSFEPTAKKKENAKIKQGQVVRAFATMGGGSAALMSCDAHRSNLLPATTEDEKDYPNLTMVAALLLLLVSTALIAFNTQFATDSIQGLLEEAGLSESFVGTIILPILSLDPTSVVVAVKDKMDMSISLTLERCMQTALMVVPLIVLLAWGMGIDAMTLEFDSLSVAALFISIVIVTYVVQEGKSNW